MGHPRPQREAGRGSRGTGRCLLGCRGLGGAGGDLGRKLSWGLERTGGQLGAGGLAKVGESDTCVLG